MTIMFTIERRHLIPHLNALYSTNLSNKVERLIESVGACILMRDEQVCPAAGGTVSMHCSCKTRNNEDILSLFTVS